MDPFDQPIPSTSKQTLSPTAISRVPFEAGICDRWFQHLQTVLQELPPCHRLCTLMFDEMPIREHVQYDSLRDCVEGLEDHGHKYKSSKLANHVLVFMAHAVDTDWLQPLAFYFNNGPISSDQLQAILLDVLDACEKHQLQVVSCVCDMATSNVKALRQMNVTVSNPFIANGSNRIACIFDPPSLLKSFRNLFFKHPINVPVTIAGTTAMYTARWEHLHDAYDVDNRSKYGVRWLYEITPAHLKPSKKQKTKLKLAAQIFSRRFATFIYMMIGLKALPDAWKGTGTLLGQMNRLFDSCRGFAKTHPDDDEDFPRAVSKDSAHWKCWKEMFKFVSELEFVRSSAGEAGSPNLKPPTQIGWLQTIKAFSAVCNYLIRYKSFSVVRIGTFNLIALGNLFEAIRSFCGSNDAPTASEFTVALKTLVVSGGIKHVCETIDCEKSANLLSNFETFLDVHDHEDDGSTEENVGGVVNVSTLADEVQKSMSSARVDTFSAAHVSGFIAKRFLDKIGCDFCRACLSSDSSLSCNVSDKEVGTQEGESIYPSEELVASVDVATSLLENMLPELVCNAVEVRKRATEHILGKIDFSWINCHLHGLALPKVIITVVCCVVIPRYCTRTAKKRKARTNAGTHRKKLNKSEHPP